MNKVNCVAAAARPIGGRSRTADSACRLTMWGLIVAGLAVAPVRQVAAASIVYTDKAAFAAALPAGTYFEKDFAGYPTFAPQSELIFSGGTPAVTYTITAPTAGVAVFPDAGFAALGNWNSSQDLTVAFTSGNVVAAGAEFWLSNIDGVRQAGELTVQFSDGTSGIVPSAASGPFGFLGVALGSGTLTSMKVLADGDLYLNVSSIYAAGVPEPSACSLLAIAGVWLTTATGRRRRNRG